MLGSIVLLLSAVAAGEPIFWQEAALTLLGVSEWEELDEEVAERLADRAARPLPLNTASLTVMQESGLLSFYQCAVIEEWRTKNGDILSFEELAILDGFSRETAQALRPFVCLSSSALPGRSSLPSGRTRHNLTWRASGELARERETVASGSSGVSASSSDDAKAAKGSMRVATGLKYAMDWSGRLQCGLGGSVTLPFVPQAGAVSSGAGGGSASAGGLTLSKVSWDARALHPYIRWNGQKWLTQVLVGDYQLRFSQGLCLWSGFSLSGFSAPDSFVRRPTGISPYGSFSQTPALRGVAAQFWWNAFRLSVATNVSHLLQSGRFSRSDDFLAAELNWHTRRGYLSLTGVSTGKVSLGGHFCWAGYDVYGEACFDGSGAKPAWAALVGTCLPIIDAFKASLSLRYYSPDFPTANTGSVRAGTQCANEAGAALGLQWKGWRKATLTASLDACLHPRTRDVSRKHTAQIKSQVDGVYTPAREWSLQGRATARFRNYDRRQKYDAKLSAVWQPAFLRWNPAPDKPSSGAASQPASPSLYIQVNGGAALCHCKAWGVLLHLEESLHTPWGSVYLQEGWHRAPQWDDRLYLYERNAPGTFRVPARYGQGWFLHLYLSGFIPSALPASSASYPDSASPALHSSPRFKYYLGLDYQDFTYKTTRHQTLTLRLQLNAEF